MFSGQRENIFFLKFVKRLNLSRVLAWPKIAKNFMIFLGGCYVTKYGIIFSPKFRDLNLGLWEPSVQMVRQGDIRNIPGKLRF